MKTMDAIRTRRSIRAYQDKPVSPDLIRDLITAAMYAPSAGDAQPWHFLVIDEKSIMTGITAVHPYAEMAAKAPCAIVVCADPRLEKYPGNWVCDCSAAIQNLLLAAHDHDLGAVWTAIYPNADIVKSFQKKFTIPAEIIPLAMVVIGYPAETLATPARYRLDRVHKNAW